MIKTTDAGTSWGFPTPLSGNAGADIGDDRNSQLSTDRSGTWIAAWNSTENVENSIGLDKDILYSASIDGGTNWNNQTSGTTKILNSVSDTKRFG